MGLATNAPRQANTYESTTNHTIAAKFSHSGRRRADVRELRLLGRWKPSMISESQQPVRTLTLNGEARATVAGDLAALVAELGLEPRKVAIERNLEIVPRSLYAQTPLADGDRIEIVHFIGGG
jgi:thiamine biosynthesis protein ThiS